MAICLGRSRSDRPPRGGCPVPWPRRAASSAMLRVAAGGITLFTPDEPALVSVALAVGHPTPACAGHPALRCLDFPLRRSRSGHPSSCDQQLLYQYRSTLRRFAMAETSEQTLGESPVARAALRGVALASRIMRQLARGRRRAPRSSSLEVGALPRAARTAPSHVIASRGAARKETTGGCGRFDRDT